MSKCLLLYATNSGSTFLVAQEMIQQLEAAGHTVTLKEIDAADPQEFSTYDAIVMGSPSWDNGDLEGQPHADFAAFMEKSSQLQLNNQKVAVFGTGDRSYQYFCGAVDHLEKFVQEHQGQLLQPSLRIDQFYQRQAESQQQIADWITQLAPQL